MPVRARRLLRRRVRGRKGVKVYLAGPFERGGEIARIGLLLMQRGHVVTARWLVQHEEARDSRELRRQAAADLEDIGAADALVAVTLPGSPRGGRHVEFGYALALGKRVVILGQPENVFHHLPQVERVGSVEELAARLR